LEKLHGSCCAPDEQPDRAALRSLLVSLSSVVHMPGCESISARVRDILEGIVGGEEMAEGHREAWQSVLFDPAVPLPLTRPDAMTLLEGEGQTALPEPDELFWKG
jgi:hypothetical protein